ncbi:TetR/AcrR family transcriptional regulator [Paenibacillus elgii]
MSPRTKEQNEEIRLLRVKQIMQAAAEVYLEQGITMEMRDVANKANLGYGTVYHYYKNKHALLDDLLWQAFHEAKQVTEEAFGAPQPPGQQLRRYGTLILRQWFHDRSVYILYKMIWENFQQVPGGRFQKLYDQFQIELYRPLVSAIQQLGAQEPEKRANLLLGSMIGCAGLWIHHGHEEPDTNDIADSLVRSIEKKGNLST